MIYLFSMKLILKTYLTIVIIFCLASCTDKIVPDGNDHAIGMSAGIASTRVTEAGIDDLKSSGFSVYGGYLDDDPTKVFDGDLVSTTNGIDWGYVNTKYWTFNTYSFYAVHPTTAAASYNAATGEFTINHNILDNQDLDLLIAKTENHEYPDDGPVVNMNFTHALVQVSFQAKKDASAGTGTDPVKIESVSLYGVPSSGTYSSKSDTWTYSSVTTEVSPFVQGSDITLETTPKDIFGGAQLMLPAQYIPNTYILKVKHTEDNYPVVMYLSSASLHQWEPGKKYTYTFTIIDKDLIIFDPPKVTPWTESNGNVIIVE